MSLPQNVGEVDHNVRMFLAVPALIGTVESAMVFQAYALAAGFALAGAAVFASGWWRYCPLYHALRFDTCFAARASTH